MAKTNKDRTNFIELRAQGFSFEKISKELNISKPTLMKWEKHFIKNAAPHTSGGLKAFCKPYCHASIYTQGRKSFT